MRVSWLISSAASMSIACGGGGPAPSTTPNANPPAGATATPAGTPRLGPDPLSVPPTALKPTETPAELAKKYDPQSDTVARLRALGEIAPKIREIRNLPEAQQGPALVAYLKSRADVEDAGDVPGVNAWGRFRDGRLMLIETREQMRPTAARAELESRHGARGAKVLTEGKRATIVDAMRFDVAGSTNYKSWSTKSGYDATLAIDGAAAPNRLLNAVGDDGFFYINAHGGEGFERAFTNEAIRSTFSLTTSQRVVDCDGRPLETWYSPNFTNLDLRNAASCSDATIPTSLWAAGEITYTYALNMERTSDNPNEDVQGNGWHYGITHRYVRNHFTMKPNSIVYLNACKAGGATAADMRNAFLSVNAGAVIAFDDDIAPEKGIQISNFFIDRLLGTNASDQATTPPQRPWDLDTVREEAHAKGLDFTFLTRTGATAGISARLRIFRSSGPGGEMLVPSIKYLDVNESRKMMTVYGDFGDDPGSQGFVTVNGDPCVVKRWTDTKIECDLGFDFKTGDVLVKSRDRKSNAVPLTGWKFTVDSDFELPRNAPGNIDFAWSFDVHMRGDVHKYRESKPSDTGKEREEYDVYASSDSICSPKPQGFISVPNATVTARNIPPFGATYAPSTNGSCILFGKLDPAAKTLKFAIWAQQPASQASFTANGRGMTRTTPGMPFMLWPEMSDGTLQLALQFALPANVQLPPEALARLAGHTIPVKSVTLHFNENWAIADLTKNGQPGAGTKALFRVHAARAPTGTPTEKTAQ